MTKTLSREQLETRKEKAVRFVDNVLGDPDRAAEISEESLDDYAARRKITLSNPAQRFKQTTSRKENRMPRENIDDLKDRIEDLEEENEILSEKLDAVAQLVSDEDDADDEDGEAGEA